MNNLPSDPLAAYRAGQLDAYGKLLAELNAAVRAVEVEIARLDPPPLPSRTPNLPQVPQGGGVR